MMEDLGDFVHAEFARLFKFSSWSASRKASFIATLAYGVSLYSFVAVSQIKDRQLNQDLKEKGTVVQQAPDNEGNYVSILSVMQDGHEIDTIPFGNSRGWLINTQ